VISQLLTEGQFGLFLDLTSPEDNLPQYVCPSGTTRWHIPTPDRGILPDHTIAPLISQLSTVVLSGHRIYIHCRGGHGRSATVAACLYGYISQQSGPTVLSIIYQSHQTRRVMKPTFRRMGAPQTLVQKQQVLRLLT
jgi:protein-tyrosine phosphatase